jgi:hypothetical protein
MGAAAMLLLGVATWAQAQGQDRRGDDKDRADFQLQKIQDYQVLLAKGSSTPCDTATQAACTIEMKVISVDGRDYCLALAPELKVKTDSSGGFFNKKRLVWKLSATSLKGKALAFHADSGIVITVDADHQIDPKGAYGDGSGGAASTDLYHVKTSRKKLNAVSGYLPVVLWGAAGDEELCAAIDPKIVNVN